MTGLILRGAGLVLCGGLWWWLSVKAQTQAQAGALLLLLWSHAALLVAAIILAKPIAGLIGDMIANLLMPGERHARPQPMYSIPEGRMVAEDYAGALEAYEQLAADHPEEVAPHLRMMEIWLRHFNDPAAARTIHRNALHSIKGRSNKAKFAAAAGPLLAEAVRRETPGVQTAEAEPET
jgi:hypothetical protein